MKEKLKKHVFKKGNSANGNPHIDIENYEYTAEEFAFFVDFLCLHYKISRPKIISDGLDTMIADIKNGNIEVYPHMDNWFFLISFNSEKERDEIYRILTGE
jgi:hypothetical protein